MMTTTHAQLIAAQYRNSGFSVKVQDNKVQPSLNRKLDRLEVERVILDLLEAGIAKVTRSNGAYLVEVA